MYLGLVPALRGERFTLHIGMAAAEAAALALRPPRRLPGSRAPPGTPGLAACLVQELYWVVLGWSPHPDLSCEGPLHRERRSRLRLSSLALRPAAHDLSPSLVPAVSRWEGLFHAAPRRFLFARLRREWPLSSSGTTSTATCGLPTSWCRRCWCARSRTSAWPESSKTASTRRGKVRELPGAGEGLWGSLRAAHHHVTRWQSPGRAVMWQRAAPLICTVGSFLFCWRLLVPHPSPAVPQLGVTAHRAHGLSLPRCQVPH